MQNVTLLVCIVSSVSVNPVAVWRNEGGYRDLSPGAVHARTLRWFDVMRYEAALHGSQGDALKGNAVSRTAH